MTTLIRFLAFFIFTASILRAADSPPNIVMIISDDQLWSDYGFMEHPHLQTPNLDRLSRESLTFTRGYDVSSLCCPSLATMITGLYPHQHKVTSNDPPVAAGAKSRDSKSSALFDQGREVMSRHLQEAGTLPTMLKQKGYLSLQTGKWWLKHFSNGGFTHGMTEGGRHGDKGLDIGRKTMQPIYDFIAEAKTQQKPFFIWYAPMMPHDPHTPPQRLLDKYKSKAPSDHVAKYWGMVEWFDETCGELLKHIDDNGLKENTIIIYLSDNGWITNPATGRYAAKSKQSQYDGGLRTPIMIRWPGKAKPEMSKELAQAIDIAPTLLRAAGLEPAKNMPGINLLDSAAVSTRKAIYGECFTHNFVDLNVPSSSLRWRWMIEGSTKLILPDPKNQPNDVAELYDIDADPTEEKNLAGSKADKVKELSAKMDAWWKP